MTTPAEPDRAADAGAGSRPSPRVGGENPGPTPNTLSGGAASARGGRRRILLVALGAAAVVALAVRLWPTRPPPPDVEQMVGDWQVTRRGDPPGTASPLRVRVTRQDDGSYRWVYLTPTGRETGAHRLTVNPAADPKELDLTVLDAGGRVVTFTHGPGKGL